MMKAYHIVQWDTLYETSETRKVRTLTYYAKPNKLIGLGIGRTLQHAQNVALLGTWALIEALASTAERDHRGWLVRNGAPLTAEQMAYLTRVDPLYFEAALAHFADPTVGWLELGEWPSKKLSDGNHPETSGRPPGVSPGVVPPAGNHPETSGTISLRERDDRQEREGERERGTPARSPADAGVPSLEEVLAWAKGHASGIDPEFAGEKHAEHSERSGWKVRGKLIDWQERFPRYWKQDGPKWVRNRKKNAARGASRPGDSASRPDGWKEGDQDWWWTDGLATVQAALSGAVMKEDEKTAARLREVLAHRRAK